MFALRTFFFFCHPQVAAVKCTMCVSTDTARTQNMQLGEITRHGRDREKGGGRKERRSECENNGKVKAKE